MDYSKWVEYCDNNIALFYPRFEKTFQNQPAFSYHKRNFFLPVGETSASIYSSMSMLKEGFKVMWGTSSKTSSSVDAWNAKFIFNKVHTLHFWQIIKDHKCEICGK